MQIRRLAIFLHRLLFNCRLNNCWRGRLRQLNGDQQTVLHVGRADVSAMQLHCPLCDREPQPNAAAGTLARLTNAIKRFKDVAQFSLGHAWTEVAYCEQRRIELASQRNLDCRTFGGVTNRVANNVFNPATQQLPDAASYRACKPEKPRLPNLRRC